MISCVYTKHKKRKLKSWFDGFVTLEKNKMKLFDEDKKMIDSKSMNKLTNDIETMRHIIYIENISEEKDIVADEDSLLSERERADERVCKSSEECSTNRLVGKKVNNTEDNTTTSIGRSNEDILNLFRCTK